MKPNEAISLITHNDFIVKDTGIWADLGCGTGTFTLALSNILEKNSIIYAVDFNKPALERIPDVYNSISIKKITADFTTATLPFNNLDGVLMANSLHYVKEKDIFISKLKKHLNKNACFLVIEYDSNIPNTWVPYPIDFKSLVNLFSELGYSHINKLHSRPSIYGNQMYSALIR